jgi:hypothetical protein
MKRNWARSHYQTGRLKRKAGGSREERAMQDVSSEDVVQCAVAYWNPTMNPTESYKLMLLAWKVWCYNLRGFRLGV